MRLRRHIQEQHESSHGIDLAPMLDFVLNLLIFFIITAIFVKESGLLVNRPTSISTDTKSESIAIQILDTGEIYVDNRVVDARAVRANVERMHAVNPQSGVLILADENAPTGTVVQVVDQVHLGGIWNITFSTSE
ncbi:MAG: biopolymer transporter ExbD [Gammaproteobacteria bacterium]|nr:biopolymer transporter ExbD [Gammaproteobacteria bacterium]